MLTVASIVESIDHDAIAYRHAGGVAIVIGGSAAVFFHPDRFSDVAYLPEPSEAMDAGLTSLHSAPTTNARGKGNLHALLWWASKRSPPTEWAPGDDEVAFNVRRPSYDAQPCLGQPINRVLMREVLQAVVQLGYRPWTDSFTVELREHNGGPIFELRCDGVVAFVMGMANKDGTLEVGDDAVPLEWSGSGVPA